MNVGKGRLWFMSKGIMRIVCFIMLLCVAGCGSTSADVSKEDESGAGFESTEKKDGVVSALSDNGELPEEGILCGFRYRLGASDAYDTKYKDRGYYRYEHDERAPLVLELCGGEHSTGGYAIRIVNLEADEEGNLCVTVEETAPKPEEMVTEAFTYPKTVLLIYEETKMPGSVTVKTTGGAELPFLGSVPPMAADAVEINTAKQDENTWEKVVIAPPEGAYCNITLCLPKDWDYSWGQSEDVPVSDISVGIYPKAEGDARGCISIQYAKGFGVCGTGLTSVETTFNGHAAHKGTYDDHPYWDFIALSGDYSGCAIINCAGETWFDQYREELEEILATVEFELALRDGLSLKDDPQEDIGEIYAKDPAGSDIAMTTDGIK